MDENSEDSNIDELIASMDSFLDSFNFQRKGIEGSLGKDVAMTIIRGPDVASMGGIMGRIADKVQPDGTPMKPNAPTYAAEKDRAYGWSEVGRRTGQAFSQVSLYGRTTIGPYTIEMRYGTDATPTSSVSPNGHISDADQEITDTRKGMFLTQQGRAFYVVNDEDRQNVIGVTQANLDDHIKEWNQGNGTG